MKDYKVPEPAHRGQRSPSTIHAERQDMISLETHPDGQVLSVRAAPGARRNGVTGVYHGLLKVSVTQAPEKGKANKAILEVLAQSLGLRKSQLELLSGETSQQKKFLVRGISAEALRALIATALPPEVP